ncbi:MAG: hypothetical protein IJT53_03035 [Prevotella sp.]|nr:hypothetical protein [Prevotella sp.]
MKKMKFLALALLAAMAGKATAQESVSVSDLEVPQGGTATLEVNYSLEGEGPYVGFMFIVDMPDGLSLVEDTENPGYPWYDDTVTAISRLSITTTTNNGFAATPKTATSTISGNSGVLMRMEIAADASLGVGSTHTITVKEISFNVRDESYNVTKRTVGDVTFTVTIGEPDDGRLKFDENAIKLPTYTAGDKADVTVTRTIKAGEWSTLVLPFNLTKANATAAFGSDVKFAKFANYTIDYGDDEENVTPLGITVNLTDYSIPARGNLAGGTPVLIKTSQDITEFQLDGITLTSSVKDVEGPDADYDLPGKFTGTLVKSVIPADGLFISDNKFWYSTGKTNVKAFRCWFEFGAVLDKETDFGARVILHFDDESTDIRDHCLETNTNDHYYDLQGRSVIKPSKGLYIRNGRKEIIR